MASLLVIEHLEQIEDSVLVSGDVVGCSSRAGKRLNGRVASAT